MIDDSTLIALLDWKRLYPYFSRKLRGVTTEVKETADIKSAEQFTSIS